MKELKTKCITLADERDRFEALAESWMEDYDKLKEKYEPSYISTGEEKEDLRFFFRSL